MEIRNLRRPCGLLLLMLAHSFPGSHLVIYPSKGMGSYSWAILEHFPQTSSPYEDQAGLKLLIETFLPLPLKCWN